MRAAPSVLIYLIPAVIAAGMTIFAWQRRYYRGGRPFTLLIAAIAWWCGCHALSIADPTFEGTLFWSLLQNVGIVLVGPCWLLLALAYSGEWWRTSRWLRRAIFAPELALLVIALTNSLHGLWWPSVAADMGRPYLWLTVSRGPAFWAHSAYAYSCILVGAALLARAALQAVPVNRYHARLMLIAVLIPALGNLTFLLGLRVPWDDDPTPLLLLSSAALALYATMRYQLVDLAPLAEREVVAGLPDGLVVIDSRGLVAEANSQAPRLLGLAGGRWAGRRLSEIVGPSPFAADVRELLAAAPAAQARHAIAADGAQAVELRLRPLLTVAGSATGALLLVRDISERVRIDQERTRHVAALRLINTIARAANGASETGSLLETIAAAIVADGSWERVAVGLLDERGERITVAADRLAAGAGRLAGRVIDGPPAAALIGQIRGGGPRLIDLDDLAAADPLAEGLRGEGLRALLAVPLRHEGQAAGILALASARPRVVTPALLELAAAMGELITDAIIRTRLYEQVRRADRLKAGFLATVSHELRTPLTSIMGYTDMLQRGSYGPPSPPMAEALGYMRESSLTLMRLISDILEFSRMEAGGQTVDLHPVDLARAAQSVAGQLLPLARAQGLTIELAIAAQLPPARANTARVEQVLANLVGNAIKFSPAGGTITISAQRRGAGLRLSVRDTGIGIAPGEQALIFEEFHRGRGPGGQRSSGVGLGLAISRRLLALMGGTISVESEPGAGAVFHCDLPAADAARAVGGSADA